MIIILMGVTGCGKTTIGKLLSEELNLLFLDADDYHSSSNIEKMKSGEPLNDEDRKPWLKTLAGLISKKEKYGGCVLACSALKQSYRELLTRNSGHGVYFVYLKGTPALLTRRLANRDGHFMAKNLLNSQFKALEEPLNCITVNIDKTPRQLVEEITNCIKLKKYK